MSNTKQIKHTPGPWLVQTYSNHRGWSVYAGERGCIAERWYDVERTDIEDAEMRANARLIAAAPELLAMLQDIEHAINVGYFSDTGRETHLNYMNEITKLIAKATGGAE